MRGVEWPYGWTAFKVRLFAGDTVVEQLVFVPPGGRLGLEYQQDGFGTHIAPTTEDGESVAVSQGYFDGAVTLHVAHPWVAHAHWAAARLIPDGPDVRPTTDGGERNDWDFLVLLADPQHVQVGTACLSLIGPAPADAAALAESIRSDPGIAATAPVAVSAGENDTLMMDVVIAAGAGICDQGILGPVFDPDADSYQMGNGPTYGRATGDWMRLYLFDAPEGSSVRILVIAVVAPESRLESVAAAAAPILDSIEFPTP